MDTGGAWAPLDFMHVPLVPFGLDTRDESVDSGGGPPTAFVAPDANGTGGGLYFQHNGNGGVNFLRNQPPEMLQWEWRPAGCSLRNLTRQDVQMLLRNTWVHLDGDSLVRDIFYDLLETLEMGGFGREKRHENMPAHVRDVGALAAVQPRVSRAASPCGLSYA